MVLAVSNRLRGLAAGGLPMTRSLRINNLLLHLREWNSRRRKGGAVVTVPDHPVVHTTVLAGDLSADRGARAFETAAGLAGGAPVQVLGFNFDGPGVVAPDRGFLVTGLAGCRFPEFFPTLTSALLKIAGERLVVLTPDLPGLGLGLLANFHFQKPLRYSGSVEAAGPADWDDPDLLDANSRAWRGILGGWAGEVPQEDGAPAGVLPAARQFAEAFAGFHRKNRGRP